MADNLGFGGNPYLESTIDNALGDTVRNYNLAVQPAFNSAMVRSGSFGNSGIQQMNDEAQRQLQSSLGQQANNARFNDYWTAQNFNRGVYNDTFAQNQQNFQNGLSVLGLGNQAGVQNLGLGTQIQNTPLNYYQGFANTANGIGQGYGTTTGTTSAQGSPLMGALGGWQLGGQIGKNFGGWGGGGWGGGGSSTQFPEYGMASGATGGWV
jgi:hypothetical protein